MNRTNLFPLHGTFKIKSSFFKGKNTGLAPLTKNETDVIRIY